MTLNSIDLTNFRNYSKANFDFGPQTTLVVGPNTSGKTNLLEAIYFLATGKSFRAGYDREAIAQGAPFANLKSQIVFSFGNSNLKHDEGKEIELQILTNENGGNISSKRFKINGVKKRLSDFVGNLRAVVFSPEQIQLVTGSPSRRRKYLDSVLVQVDREYARALLEYEKVLRQRNRLLLLIRAGEARREQLDVWDGRLGSLGFLLTSRREKFFASINNQLLIDSKNRRLDRTASNLFLDFLKSTRSWSQEKIPQILEREIAAGMTLWGPHRDDFLFLKVAPSGSRELHSGNPCAIVNDRGANPNVPLADPSVALQDLAVFGSRGEQRLAVLHLKLAELEFITNKVGERPVLLLDDIFSELDEDNRGRVLELFDKQQTIITATDLDQIDGEKLRQHKVMRLGH